MKNNNNIFNLLVSCRSAAKRGALGFFSCLALAFLFSSAGLAEESSKPPQVVSAEAHSSQTQAATHDGDDDHGGHDVLVNSTADDKDSQLISKAIEHASSNMTVHEEPQRLQDKPKASLKVEMEKHAEEQMKPEKPAPLNIRLAGMPSRYSPPPLPTAVIRPKPEKTQAAAEKKEEIQPQVSKEAMEALTAIRKRELAAIEKDKATLAALQAAIKDLGVSDKISFAKEKGSLIGKETSSAGGAVAKGAVAGAAPAKETPKL